LAKDWVKSGWHLLELPLIYCRIACGDTEKSKGSESATIAQPSCTTNYHLTTPQDDYPLTRQPIPGAGPAHVPTSAQWGPRPGHTGRIIVSQRALLGG
jgi:hypothetical protein